MTLSDQNLYRILSKRDIFGYNLLNATVKEKDVILLHGGGNFGDVYLSAQKLRLDILQMFPLNQIIFLPQTIKYSNFNLYKQNQTKIIESHKNLTMTFRSDESHSFALKNFPHAKSILLPDSAFFLGDLKNSLVRSRVLYDVLILRRTDTESKFPLSEWNQAYLEHLSFKFSYLDVDWFFYTEQKINSSSKNYLETLSSRRQVLIDKVISQARVIVTDRLHASIYSLLINKPLVIVHDKNKKLLNTLTTAFHRKIECSENFLDYSFASNPNNAVKHAVTILKFLK